VLALRSNTLRTMGCSNTKAVEATPLVEVKAEEVKAEEVKAEEAVTTEAVAEVKVEDVKLEEAAEETKPEAKVEEPVVVDATAEVMKNAAEKRQMEEKAAKNKMLEAMGIQIEVEPVVVEETKPAESDAGDVSTIASKEAPLPVVEESKPETIEEDPAAEAEATGIAMEGPVVKIEGEERSVMCAC